MSSSMNKRYKHGTLLIKLNFSSIIHATNIATVFSIVNEEPNAEDMKAKVKAYEEANRPQIVIRQSQRADIERCTADRYVICFTVAFQAKLHLLMQSLLRKGLHPSRGMLRDERENFKRLKRPWH